MFMTKQSYDIRVILYMYILKYLLNDKFWTNYKLSHHLLINSELIKFGVNYKSYIPN